MSLWQISYTVSLILGVLGTAFTAGYNWRRITQLENVLAKHLEWVEAEHRVTMEQMARDYVRKDVLVEMMSSVRNELMDIKTQLERLVK